MQNFTLDLYKKSTLHRYVTLSISMFYALNLFAQRDIPQRINDVVISKDTKVAQKLIQQITEDDIAQMADSTLFWYNYMVGWNAFENNQHNKAIDYLVKAKELCETKLGIENHVNVYFEILKFLGEKCEYLGKYDEALLWYEEGIIKGLPYINTVDEPLKSYFKRIRDNAAEIFEEKGHKDMADYWRTYKSTDYIGSFDYADDLLDQALSLHLDGNSGQAINLLDNVKEIFQKSDAEGKGMMSLLYRVYLQCYISIGDTAQIDKLLKTKWQEMYIGDEKTLFVYDMETVINSFIIKHHDIKIAEKYYQYVVKECDKSNSDEVATVAKLGKALQFYKSAYSQIDSLQQIRLSLPTKDYQWGIVSLQLSNILISITREKEAYDICEEIYAMSSKLYEDPHNLHWFVLMNLADYGISQERYHIAERFLKEQQSWLDARNYAENAESRGWVYYKLGITYMNSSQYENSGRAYSQAEEILLPIYKKESSEYATILHNRGRLAQLQGQLDEAKALLTEAQRIQISIDGEPMDRTVQYLNEVEQTLKVRL